MMAVERQRKIADLVNEKGSIRVHEISQLFDVTPETARRDLDLLESEGKLRRTHGGAVRMDDGQGDVPYVERESTNSKEKLEVARLALSHISAGDKIALDASSTAWFLAREIPDMPLTVLTNSVRVIQELSSKERIQVISTGGILRSQSMSFVGPLAEETLSKYYVNKAFISCKGVHLEYGVSEANEWQAIVKRRMTSIADETYLLVDHTKFGLRDFTHVLDLADVAHILTDSQVPDEVNEKFLERGTQIERS
ncbi:DeoR/GlpR family DNA-binding transcription regulator [Alicyclobacillus fastidiosus]|uniref:DeoR/GlpR family DNA-binding transcription regulator n=2 Tax=Alicyclobacillus fastidiosus TaxID=392011 RepID=A0ABV5AJB9_9BACL|nr:DeoR/GlpR family DNA-binding transcription regulator [Alicyclobacillus fastidiosus]WEH12080.1 DeoR/GlpR family DNA-binding transcription regulator [Alicyclobacillus fastidiosus]